MNMPRLLLAAALPLVMLAASPGAHAECTSAAKSYIAASYASQATLDKAANEKILSEMVANPPPGIMDSNGINNCVAQNWPSMFPGAASILAGVGSQIVNQLCTAARQRIAAATPNYLNTIYSSVQNSQIPTSSFGANIPGMPANIPVNTGASSNTTTTTPPTSTTYGNLGGLFGGGNP